jgi:hypothetical protein
LCLHRMNNATYRNRACHQEPKAENFADSRCVRKQFTPSGWYRRNICAALKAGRCRGRGYRFPAGLGPIERGYLAVARASRVFPTSWTKDIGSGGRIFMIPVPSHRPPSPESPEIGTFHYSQSGRRRKSVNTGSFNRIVKKYLSRPNHPRVQDFARD